MNTASNNFSEFDMMLFFVKIIYIEFILSIHSEPIIGSGSLAFLKDYFYRNWSSKYFYFKRRGLYEI